MFEEAYNKSTLAHGYLIVGDDVGPFIHDVAGRILCEEKAFAQCGKCEVCQGFGNHPEHYIFSLDRDGSIGIKDVHELISRSSLSTHLPKNIVVIHRANLLTREAQSALLKTLEEPSPSTMFFLGVVTESDLLPTLRSRLVTHRIGGEKEMKSCLGKPFYEAFKDADVKDRDVAIDMLKNIVLEAEQAIHKDASSAPCLREASAALYALEHTQANAKINLENVFVACDRIGTWKN